MKKRLLSLILTAAMLTGPLCACSESKTGEANEPETQAQAAVQQSPSDGTPDAVPEEPEVE